jgi:hypothetical protein
VPPSTRASDIEPMSNPAAAQRSSPNAIAEAMAATSSAPFAAIFEIRTRTDGGTSHSVALRMFAISPGQDISQAWEVPFLNPDCEPAPPAKTYGKYDPRGWGAINADHSLISAFCR